MTATSLFTDMAGNVPLLTFMHDMGALTRGRRYGETVRPECFSAGFGEERADV